MRNHYKIDPSKTKRNREILFIALIFISIFFIARLYVGEDRLINPSTMSGNTRELLKENSQNAEAQASFSLLLITIMLVACFLIAYLIRQSGFIYLHESSSTLIFGCLLGLIIRFFTTVDKLKSLITFDQETFFIYLLPPIIFESGYNMHRKRFFKNFGSIAALAFVGTTINAFLFSGLLFLCSNVGMFGSVKFSYLETLIFGSLISATDPVTVLAIFKELRVDFDLYANVFGESVFNDAIAIVLYRTVATFLTRQITVSSLILAVGEFLLIFFGSFGVGTIMALIIALLLKYTTIYKYIILEGALVVLFGYMSYLLADGLGLSGVVSILFCGIVMAHYTQNNMSKQTQHYTSEMFEVFAILSETFIFIYLGMAIFSFNHEYNLLLIVMSILICLVARAAHVFPLSWIVNCGRRTNKIPATHQFIVWFAGLRGALAFALSIHVPTPNGGTILTTTLFIALFTVLFLGGFTTKLLSLLKIKTGLDPSLAEVDDDKEEKNNRFYLLDRYYLKPFFTVAYEPKTLNVPLELQEDHGDYHKVQSENLLRRDDHLLETSEAIQMEDFTDNEKNSTINYDDDEEHR
eukprot:TRINITY_DN6070_c0_g1_i1.p1 TRINITY_DN6070_c0_g1~~TRINITY_DN6070_c0_g1_i1.p1  ORF type:complete len:580 (+),score=137.75 TRINITY_DN6070_c0_g1_i1:55-1794(+)